MGVLSALTARKERKKAERDARNDQAAQVAAEEVALRREEDLKQDLGEQKAIAKEQADNPVQLGGESAEDELARLGTGGSSALLRRKKSSRLGAKPTGGGLRL